MAEQVKIELSRDLKVAKDAYEAGDGEASMKAHDALTGKATENHGGAGSEFIKSIIFGGLDGIITTFAIIAASAGAGFGLKVILLMGFANLVADAISMGFGDYLSERAELDHAIKERKREMWEVENYLQGEKKEMIEIYEKKGLSTEEATTVIDILARHKEMFVDLMMVDELGLSPPDEDDAPWKNGVVTFLAFLVFGSVPLWCYVVFYLAKITNERHMFIACCVCTAATMFLLGVFKATMTHQNKIKSGVLMCLNGSCAAAAAYLVGWLFEEVLGVQM